MEFGIKKVIIIDVPIPQHKTFQKSNIILVRGEEILLQTCAGHCWKQDFAEADVQGQKSFKAKATTLTVFDAILEDIIFLAKIVAKRLRVKLELCIISKYNWNEN